MKINISKEQLLFEIEKLRQTLEEYRLLIDYQNDLVVKIDIDGKFLFANKSYCETFGLKEDELLGKFYMFLVHEEDREATRTAMQKLYAPPYRCYVEQRALTKDGLRWFGWSDRAILDDNGNVTAIVGVGRDIAKRKETEQELDIYRKNLERLIGERTSKLIDVNKKLVQEITERKHIEEELRKSEEKFRTIFNKANDFMLLHKINEDGSLGNFIEVNEVACDKLGYTREEFLKLAPRNIRTDGVSREVLSQIMQQIFTKGQATFENNFRTKEGKKIPVELNSHYIDFNGQKVILAIARDITQRKKVEKELQDSEERYRQLVEFLPNAIIVHHEGKITFANQAAADIIGEANPDILIGQNVTSFLTKGYLNVYTRSLHKITIEKSIDIWTEFKIKRKDGILVDIEATSAPITYLGETAVLAVIRDITERKKLEQELLRTTKLESLGILAGGIAHDFNNILTVIMGNVSLTKLNIDSNSYLFERLVEIEKATRQARELTHQLLTFSKGGTPIKKIIALGELIKDTAKLALSGSNVKYVFSIEQDLWAVNVDCGQVSQTLNNLIINAIQAMPHGGNVYISAENITIKSTKKQKHLPLKNGNYIKIAIKDEGIGIKKEIVEKIFDPYFTTKQGGNGLGLATAYSIIKKHDGHITVESEEGTGTTFYIYLPATEKIIEEQIEASDKIFSGRGHILVMDDDESVREVVGKMLTELGYNVTYATNGMETIEIYEKVMLMGDTFDAVIMDLTVRGGMGGKDAVKNLLKIDPDARAIVSSGYANNTILTNYKKHGFMGVVTKPFKIQELSKVINEVINRDRYSSYTVQKYSI